MGTLPADRGKPTRTVFIRRKGRRRKDAPRDEAPATRTTEAAKPATTLVREGTPRKLRLHPAAPALILPQHHSGPVAPRAPGHPQGVG